MRRIEDEPKARSRRKQFNYLKEGGLLRHISKYAVNKEIQKDEKSQKIIYEVPEDKIEDKDIITFTFTNSGSFIALEDEEIKDLNFEINSKEVKKLVDEFEEIYQPMIGEIQNFGKRRDTYISSSERVNDFLKSPDKGFAATICNWPEKARARSLKQVYKLIHQLWTLIVFHESRRVRELDGSIYTKQGSKYPASTFVDEDDVIWTCWYEPQKIEEKPSDYDGPLSSMFEGEIAWKRPDILITKGEYTSTNLSSSNNKENIFPQHNLTDALEFDLLMECKNRDFDDWWREEKVVKDQLLPYNTLFQPKNFVLLSVKSVPNWAKKELESRGIITVDNFYPGGRGVTEFKEIAKNM